METGKKNKIGLGKKIGLFVLAAAVLAAAGAGYVLTEEFSDTTAAKAEFTISANDLLYEFSKDDSLANKKYTEKIMVVKGTVSQIENADTSVNIKMTDLATGSYVIFTFQQQHVAEARKLKPGQEISIKGSCSGGIYSEILETEFISFKRCAINQ